jgi:hypothetical protein
MINMPFRIEKKYTVRDLFRDQANMWGYGGDRPGFEYTGAIVSFHRTDDRMRTCMLMGLRYEDKREDGTPIMKTFHNLVFGVDTDELTNTGERGISMDSVGPAYPLDVGSVAMNMEACRTQEEAHEHGSWIKNIEDRDKILYWFGNGTEKAPAS